jgi:hypothetical protein
VQSQTPPANPSNNDPVIVQNASGAAVSAAKTNVEGHFAIAHVTPGTYAIVVTAPGFASGNSITTTSAGAESTVSVSLVKSGTLDVQVNAKRLDRARNGLLPETGSSVYRFSQADIEALPAGQDTPLNQVLLQAPGVASDSYGQLHVRGDHANLQYRINGIIIPEPISGFGQALDTRIIDQVNLLTGAFTGAVRLPHGRCRGHPHEDRRHGQRRHHRRVRRQPPNPQDQRRRVRHPRSVQLLLQRLTRRQQPRHRESHCKRERAA